MSAADQQAPAVEETEQDQAAIDAALKVIRSADDYSVMPAEHFHVQNVDEETDDKGQITTAAEVRMHFGHLTTGVMPAKEGLAIIARMAKAITIRGIAPKIAIDLGAALTKAGEDAQATQSVKPETHALAAKPEDVAGVAAAAEAAKAMRNGQSA